MVEGDGMGHENAVDTMHQHPLTPNKNNNNNNNIDALIGTSTKPMELKIAEEAQLRPEWHFPESWGLHFPTIFWGDRNLLGLFMCV